MELFNVTYKLFFSDCINKYVTGGIVHPLLFELSISDDCNKNCEWCFCKGEHKKNYVDKHKLLDFVEDSNVEAVNITGGGEPTMHPDFKEILYGLDEIGISIGLYTNGIIDKYDKDIEEVCAWVVFNDNQKKLNINTTNGITLNERRDVPDGCSIRPDMGWEPESSEGWFEYLLEKSKNCSITWDKWIEVFNFKRNYNLCKSHYLWWTIDADGNVKICTYADNVFGNIKDGYDNVFSERDPEELSKVDLSKCQKGCKGHTHNKLFHFLDNPFDKGHI